MVGLLNERLTLKPFKSINYYDEKEYNDEIMIYGAVEEKQEVSKGQGLEYLTHYNLVFTKYLDIQNGDLINGRTVKSIKRVKNRYGKIEHLEIITE